MMPPQLLRAKRMVIAEIIRGGGLPRPDQFERAGLPVLVLAADMRPGEMHAEYAPTAESLEWRANQKRRLSHPGF